MASGATNIIPQILLEILYSIANGNRFQKVSPKRQNFEMFFPLFIGFFISIVLFQKIVIIIFFNIVFFFYLQKFLLVISLFVRSFNL
jgi:uncharacterized membrane protein YadS